MVIKIYEDYNLIYESKVDLKDKNAIKQMKQTLCQKGFENVFDEVSWF